MSAVTMADSLSRYDIVTRPLPASCDIVTDLSIISGAAVKKDAEKRVNENIKRDVLMIHTLSLFIAQYLRS
jgi:hypothetical protein